MKFLADESCAKSIVLALRTAEHDVVSIAETNQGITDEQVLAAPPARTAYLSLKTAILVSWCTRNRARQSASFS